MTPPHTQRWNVTPLASVLIAVLITLLGLGVCVGSAGFTGLWQNWQDPTTVQIVQDIRLPRTLAAALAGALLGLGGALAQGLFRNPLGDPYLLGSASGASLGVACALAASGAHPAVLATAQRLGLTGAAFIGAMGAALLTLMLARGAAHTVRLLLAGVVVGVVLGALSSLVMLAAPETLQAMQAFMLGSTALAGWDACWVMAGALCPCLAIAIALARGLDGLSLGEETARSLGLPLLGLRVTLLSVLALATAAAVAQTGLIAFVGLAAPHAVRALIQVRYRGLMVLSCLVGAVLLCAADVLSRALLAPLELPVGVVTALLGGAYMLRVLQRNMDSPDT